MQEARQDRSCDAGPARYCELARLLTPSQSVPAISAPKVSLGNKIAIDHALSPQMPVRSTQTNPLRHAKCQSAQMPRMPTTPNASTRILRSSAPAQIWTTIDALTPSNAHHPGALWQRCRRGGCSKSSSQLHTAEIGSSSYCSSCSRSCCKCCNICCCRVERYELLMAFGVPLLVRGRHLSGVKIHAHEGREVVVRAAADTWHAASSDAHGPSPLALHCALTLKITS